MSQKIQSWSKGSSTLSSNQHYRLYLSQLSQIENCWCIFGQGFSIIKILQYKSQIIFDQAKNTRIFKILLVFSIQNVSNIYKIFLTAFYMDLIPKFSKEYDKAVQRYQTNRLQAISILKAALQPHFDTHNSAYSYDYFTMKIELAGWMRDYGQTMYEQSNALLTEIITQIKAPSIKDKIQEHDLYKVKLNAYQNFAKLLIRQAPLDMQNQQSLLVMQKDNYLKYRNKMNGAYIYFRQARQQLLQKINYQINKIGYVKDEEAIWYIRCLSNMNQFLQIEIDEFKDPICIQNILDIANKAQKFYNLVKCKKEKKRQMQVHLHRCYSYKAGILRIKHKIQQALALQIKVYDFQIANKQYDDAQLSLRQIIRMFLEKNQIAKAQSYNQKAKKKYTENIERAKLRRQKVTKLLISNHEILLNKEEELFKILEEFSQEQQQYKYKFDFQIINNLIQKMLTHFNLDPERKALLYFYSAETNKYNENYEKSYKMIEASLKIPIKDKFQQINYMIEKVEILSKWKSKNPQIPQLIQKIQKQIDSQLKKCDKDPDKAYSFEKQEEEFQPVIMKYQKYREKANDKANYQFDNKDQNQLLEKLKKTQENYKKQVQKTKYKSTLQQYFSIQPHNKEQKNIHNFKTAMPAFPLKHNQHFLSFNPQDQYSNKCKEKNIPYRVEIKQLLTGCSDFNPFRQMLNLFSEQMQILLGLVKIQNLDLRNHLINEMLMQKIMNEYNHNIVKKFKINGSGMIQMDTLFHTISKMSQLAYLSFVDFHSQRPSNFHLLQIRNQQKMDIEYQKPRSLVHTIYLLGKDMKLSLNSRLTVLKLKYCNLMDDHLPEINLRNYGNLKEVSLSHNLLQGKYLHHIFTLGSVSVINLSDNPLLSLDIERWSNRFSQIGFILKVKLRNIKFGEQLRQDLKNLIYRVQLLDLSESDNLSELFEEIVQRYWQSGLQLTKLDKLILKNIDLQSIQILKFFQFFGRCKEIDFRGCKYDWETKKVIEEKKNEQLDMNIIISQRQNQNYTFNKFRLENPSFLNLP